MNINQNISKLLYALKQKGQIYKINSFKFYSEKNDRYCTKYVIYKKILIEDIEIIYAEGEPFNKLIECVEKYKQQKECYSKVDLMKYLAEEYKKIGSEADG